MEIYFLTLFLGFLFYAMIPTAVSIGCGCKELRECYSEMIEHLKTVDEASCITDAAVGTGTIKIFLKAISQFCPNIIEIRRDKLTYEQRHLYEVVIRTPYEGTEDERPVFMIDAGQEADSESVGFALYLIEQLVSCEDNEDMITKVRWVILPSTNPDGQEYVRFNRVNWRKNMRLSEDGLSFGVDISRNFEGEWKACPKVTSGFSPVYPGPAAASENETQFIQEVLNRYKKYIKMYVSLRRDGHSLSYPYGYDSSYAVSKPKLEKVAGIVATKVNQRAGSIHIFTNQSIFELNGKAHCGHSVDYAHQLLSIPYAFEMRVFLGLENGIMSEFQSLPRGYDATLRNGYYSGIREMYSIITKEDQYRFF